MKHDSKSQLVATRVTPREKALILAAATAEGRSVSELMSEAVLSAVTTRLREQLIGDTTDD